MAVAFFPAVRAGRRVLGGEGVGDAPVGSVGLTVDAGKRAPVKAGVLAGRAVPHGAVTDVAVDLAAGWAPELLKAGFDPAWVTVWVAEGLLDTVTALSDEGCVLARCSLNEQGMVGTRRHLQRLVTQRRSEPLRIAAADANRAASTGGELYQRGREHQPPATDDQHPVNCLRDLRRAHDLR